MLMLKESASFLGRDSSEFYLRPYRIALTFLVLDDGLGKSNSAFLSFRRTILSKKKAICKSRPLLLKFCSSFQFTSLISMTLNIME